jgi:hypothetical protein
MVGKCSQDMIGLCAKEAMDRIITIFKGRGYRLSEDTLLEIIDTVKEYKNQKDAVERGREKGGIDNG